MYIRCPTLTSNCNKRILTQTRGKLLQKLFAIKIKMNIPNLIFFIKNCSSTNTWKCFQFFKLRVCACTEYPDRHRKQIVNYFLILLCSIIHLGVINAYANFHLNSLCCLKNSRTALQLVLRTLIKYFLIISYMTALYFKILYVFHNMLVQRLKVKGDMEHLVNINVDKRAR